MSELDDGVPVLELNREIAPSDLQLEIERSPSAQARPRNLESSTPDTPCAPLPSRIRVYEALAHVVFPEEPERTRLQINLEPGHEVLKELTYCPHQVVPVSKTARAPTTSTAPASNFASIASGKHGWNFDS